MISEARSDERRRAEKRCRSVDVGKQGDDERKEETFCDKTRRQTTIDVLQ